MYKIGDRILYPMHGAGVIEAIEEKEILGKKQSYYIMKLPVGEMKVMIPMHNVNEIGVREIISIKEAHVGINRFREYSIDDEQNWNKRCREYMDKIKSGDIYEVLSVVKSLMCRDKKKGLSTGERKMLCSAKQILLSELVLTTSQDQTTIESLLEDAITEAIV